jgi:O-antigen/teichoic acid export membrane protein
MVWVAPLMGGLHILCGKGWLLFLWGVLRRLAYHGFIYGLTTALGRFLNWLLTPLYAYRLPVEDFGRMSELYAYMAFGTILTSLGMETAYLRFGRNGEAGTFRRAFLITLGAGLCLSGLLSLSVPWLSGPVGYKGREELLWLTIAIWTVDAWAGLAITHQRAIGAPMRYAAIQMTHVALLIGLNLYGVGWKGWGLSFILLANLIASLVKLLWALAWSPFSERPTLVTPSSYTLFRYGVVLALMGLLGATNDVLDRVILPQYSRVDNALYSAAYKVAALLALFVQAYRLAAEPLFLREAAGNTRLYARSWEAFHLVGLAGVLVFSIWAEPLLTTRWGGLLPAPLLPPAYWEALWVIPILLFANLLMGSLVQASVWYKLQEKPDVGLLITGLGSLITVVGNWYGIPRYGYGACAVTTLLAYGGMVGVSVGLGRRRLVGAFPMRGLLGAAAGVIGCIGMAQGGALLVRIGCTIVGGLWLGVLAYLRLRNRPT